MSVRTERVGAMLREALGRQFQRSLPEFLDGMITVVSVKMSPDLRIAKVYVSVYRSTTAPDILIKRLNAHTADIRKRLADDVEMRHMPELRFYRDETLDTAERIDRVLREARREDAARQAARGEAPDGATDHGGSEDHAEGGR